MELGRVDGEMVRARVVRRWRRVVVEEEEAG